MLPGPAFSLDGPENSKKGRIKIEYYFLDFGFGRHLPGNFYSFGISYRIQVLLAFSRFSVEDWA